MAVRPAETGAKRPLDRLKNRVDPSTHVLFLGHTNGRTTRERERYGRSAVVTVARPRETKKLTFADPGVKVETPPLEINELRIAGSCASGVCERQLGRDPKVASLYEKSAGSFLGSESQDVDSWGPESPRILSPTSWKFLTHGMTSVSSPRQGPCHTGSLAAKAAICNQLSYKEIHE